MPVKAARQYLELLRMSGLREVFVELRPPVQPEPAVAPAHRPSTPAKTDTLESLAKATPSRPSTPPALPAAEAAATLATRAREIQSCQKCGLSKGRNHVVYGEGCARGGLLVIGEGPGADEDRSGRPFVGRAGQLLTKMLAAINMDRQKDVYITNVVKCRPPNNRDPQPEEVRACRGYLNEQIRLIQPRLILLLGRVAAHTVLDVQHSLGSMRQRVHQYEGVPVYVTYHPAYLLRSPDMKRPAWEDLKRLRDHYTQLTNE